MRLFTMVILFSSFMMATSQAENLIQLSDLQYLGAFRVPPSIEYGGTALAYNPGSPGSLFITCLDTSGQVAEISIPTPKNGSISSLNSASLLQSCKDPTTGATQGLGGSGSSKIGGMMVYGGKLYTSVYVFYDASGSQNAWLYVKSNTNLSQSNASGAYKVGSNAPNVGFLDGWIAPVPSEWQAALGGPVASGNCCLSIITRTSYGPAAFAWDPAELTNVSTPVSATSLLYYPSSNHTLGDWNGPAPNNTTIFWNNSGTGYRGGGILLNGTRSALFFGSQGGTFCYGTGGSSGGDCYDPVDSNKGTHGYPYHFQIMAYDLNNLAAVAAGTKPPYSVLPYAVWPLTSGLVGVDGNSNEKGGGAVYDPILKRIYFSATYTDGVLPLIQVWQVNTPGGGSSPPTSPNNLQVQ
jgi:hypothetical protein